MRSKRDRGLAVGLGLVLVGALSNPSEPTNTQPPVPIPPKPTRPLPRYVTGSFFMIPSREVYKDGHIYEKHRWQLLGEPEWVERDQDYLYPDVEHKMYRLKYSEAQDIWQLNIDVFEEWREREMTVWVPADSGPAHVVPF